MCPELEDDSCAYPTLAVVVGKVAADCGAYCGEGAIGVRNQCTVAVEFPKLGTVQGTTADQALDCLRQGLVGSSWRCAPSSPTWVPVFLGSCTIP